MINKNTHFNIIKMCGDNFWADEKTLVAILNYIAEGNIKTDILHISCGIQTCENLNLLESILLKIKNMGIIIVSAFSNNQVISYPAACNTVIGVANDITIVSPNKWIYVENSVINIFATGNPQNLTTKDGKLEKKAGSSFAAAYMSAHISNLLDAVSSSDELVTNLKKKAIRIYTAPTIWDESSAFSMNRIVVFPFNKENHSLIRGINLLNPQIVKILELKFSPYIGKNAFDLFSISDYYNFVDMEEELSTELVIEDIMRFNWDTAFDTFVLGHMDQINKLWPFSISEYVYQQCLKYKKNLYSYDPIPEDVVNEFKRAELQCYYPSLPAGNIKLCNCGMLHEIGLPVVGVFGTSSKQGKWSLQLKIREILEARGYSIGHLGTEPQSLLFSKTKMCAIGYGSNINLDHEDSISLFNYLMHSLEAGNDLLIFGTQSNIIQNGFGGLATIPKYTHELIVACEPQASILCINEWDDISYINRCIKYLESFNGNKVVALAYFYKDSYVEWNNYDFKKLSLKQNYEAIVKIENETRIKAYNMNDENDIELLCDTIINYF